MSHDQFPSVAICLMLVTGSYCGTLTASEVEAIDCPRVESAPVKARREDVYRGMPFAPGEQAFYSIRYMGLPAGTGMLEVDEPEEERGSWYQSFRGEAESSDWFKAIYDAREEIRALSRSPDFAALSVSLIEEERGILSRKRVKQFALDFQQEDCRVIDHETENGEPDRIKVKSLPHGTQDVLSYVYYLRFVSFTPGEPVRTPVYVSGKNLWLEIIPGRIERVTVPAGTYNAIRVRLEIYEDGQLSEQEKFDIWIAADHANRPVVMVKAKLKSGNMVLLLNEFRAGQLQ